MIRRDVGDSAADEERSRRMQETPKFYPQSELTIPTNAKFSKKVKINRYFSSISKEKKIKIDQHFADAVINDGLSF